MKNKIAFIGAYSEPESLSSSHLTIDIISECKNAGMETLFLSPNQVRGIKKQDFKKYKKTRECNDSYGRHVILKSPSIFERNLLFRTFRYSAFSRKVIKYLKKHFVPDYIFLWSYPPFGLSNKIIRYAKKHSIKVIYDVHDIQPEILQKNNFVTKIINKSVNYSLGHSDYVFTLSEDMKNTLISKGAEANKISVIPPWNYLIDEKEELPSSISSIFSKDYYYVSYIGNIGNFQNIELLVDVAKKLSTYNDIRFVFAGSGALFEYVKSETNSLKNVIVLSRVESKVAAKLYSKCDLNIISLKKNLIKYCCPSKTPIVLKSKSNILLITDKSRFSDNLIKEGAVLVDNYVVDTTVNAILNMQKNKHPRTINLTIYDREVSLKSWNHFFTNLLKDEYDN